MIKPEYRDMVARDLPSRRKFCHLPVPMTGIASPHSWDATREHRSTSRGLAGDESECLTRISQACS